MRLKLILPHSTILDKEVKKITAPGSNGDFQIFPKHIDGTWSLRAGILSIEAEATFYYAINQGVAVKQGDTVYLSAFQAIAGESLRELGRTVEENFKTLDEKEKKIRDVLIKLETDTIKRFMEIEL